MESTDRAAIRILRRGIRGTAMYRAMLVRYDAEQYDFAGVIAADVFGVTKLGDLHRTAGSRRGNRRGLAVADNLAYRERLRGQSTASRFYELYARFCRCVVAPLFGGRIAHNVHPTFRVHFPGTSTVSKWHRDVDVTGRSDQINAWIPFVDVAETNTIWVESHYDQGDYAPYPVRYGEMLLFDGGFLAHGSVANATDTTRVSMDFRFAPLNAGDRLAAAILGGRPASLRPPADGAGCSMRSE